MPGSVQPISGALDAFPVSLYTALSTSYNRNARLSEYPDGSSQRSCTVATSLRSWRFSKRLTAAKMATLRAFYYSHVNQPFLFHDLLSGTDIKAMFVSPWSETYDLGRYTTELELAEVY